MTPLKRWIAFNSIGTLGMSIQLTVLAVLHRWMPVHYLMATVAALEVTLLHNFVWHTQYTWRDRCDGHPRLQQLLRFHLSNGLLSLAGNLLLMRLLVGLAHVPVLWANAIAVLCCSAANFWLTSCWTFGAARHPASRGLTSRHPQAGLPGTAERG